MAKFDSERIQAILLGRRAIGRFPFPFTEGDAEPTEFGIQVLSDEQGDSARLRAVSLVKKRKGDLDYDPDLLDRVIKREILWDACVDPDSDPDKPEAFFPSPADVRALDSTLINILFAAYVEHQETVSPSRFLDKEGTKELVDALKKDANARVLLSRMSPDTLRRCVRTLAADLRESSAPSRSSTESTC